MPLAFQNKKWVWLNDLPAKRKTEEVSKEVAEYGFGPFHMGAAWLREHYWCYLQKILKSYVWVESPNTLNSPVWRSACEFPVSLWEFVSPETANVLIMNAETVTEIRMRPSQTTHACIIEMSHDQVDVELPPLFAGFAAELLGATELPLQVHWSCLGLP
jgi:hypothetical protein